MGERIISGFAVDTYTAAPLRVQRRAFLDAPPRDVFAILSDHTGLEHWFPGVEAVSVYRGQALQRDGVGTVRYLHLRFYTLREYIVAYHAPYLLAYTLDRHEWIDDHLAVIHLAAERYGGTDLTWQHYFNTHMLPTLTRPLITRALGWQCAEAIRRLARLYASRRSS
jgi:uncharacterized protein YndB with AHSA1/START domain